MPKETKKMLTGAIKDLENGVEDRLEKIYNLIEEHKVITLEEIKEVSRLIKKVK